MLVVRGVGFAHQFASKEPQIIPDSTDYRISNTDYVVSSTEPNRQAER